MIDGSCSKNSTCVLGSLQSSSTLSEPLLLKEELNKLTELGLFGSKMCLLNYYPILPFYATFKIIVIMKTAL